MKVKRLVSVLVLALFLLSTPARADVLVPGQKPPRNEQSEVFVALYKDGITGWDSAYDNAFDGVKQVVLWQYPGSGEIRSRVDSGWFRDNVKPAEAFEPCYLDGEGRLWGYIGYIYGQKMNWVCLSDPANEKLPADPEVVTAVDKGVTAMVWRERAPVIALVVGLVAITGGLIYVFWYKKKKR